MDGFGSGRSPFLDELGHDLWHIVDLSVPSRGVAGNGHLEWGDGDERNHWLFVLASLPDAGSDVPSPSPDVEQSASRVRPT